METMALASGMVERQERTDGIGALIRVIAFLWRWQTIATVSDKNAESEDCDDASVEPAAPLPSHSSRW